MDVDDPRDATSPLTIGFDGRFLQDKFHGVGRYAFGLLEGLTAEGQDRLLIFVDPSLPNARFRLADLERLGRLELVPFTTPLTSPRELWAWQAQLRRTPVDVFHSPYYWSPLLLPCPLIVTVHDMIMDRYPESIPPQRRLPYRLSSLVMLRRARAIIAVSEATRADIGRFGGRAAAAKTTTVPNGVEDRFQPVSSPPDRQRVRDRYQLPPRFVLALGVRRPHKNIDGLLRAFAKIPPEVAPALVLAGGVDERFRDRAASAIECLGDRLIQLSHIEDHDLPTLYSLAELFVQPSFVEGFGFPVLEAMACGCPVACSNRSSLPEVVGDAAVRFDPTADASIAKALTRALVSGELRADLAWRGLRRAQAFRWETAAQETRNVYRRAAPAARRSATA